MKYIKNILLIVLVVFITGCATTKESLTPSEFKKILIKDGFEVKDITEDVSYAKKAYTSGKANLFISYTQGENTMDTETLYIDECKNSYSTAQIGYKEEKSRGKNWSKLIIKDENNYYALSYIEDTYIRIIGNREDEEMIQKLLKKLNY